MRNLSKTLCVFQWSAVAVVLAGLMAVPGVSFAEERDREVEQERFEEDEQEWEEEDWEEFEFEAYFAEIELYLQLMEMVTQVTEIAADPEQTAVAAMFKVEDVLEEPAEQAEFFEGLLEEVDNETIQRAIELRLVDLYQETEQTDEALEVLRKLITDDR